MGPQLQGNDSGDCSPRHFVYFYNLCVYQAERDSGGAVCGRQRYVLPISTLYSELLAMT